MNFRKYEGENVIIETIDNDIIQGYVGDYIFADDSNSEKESLIMDIP